MKPFAAVLIVLLTVTTVVRAAAGDPPGPARFSIDIDRPMWEKWGFEYPATYVFRVGELAEGAEVRRRDSTLAAGANLERKSSDDFFNGVECVRFDRAANRIYVSVGFGTSPTIELEFRGAGSVRFEGVAKYYDGRRAAYTLSNDNWGCNAWAHPGAPWKGPTDDESDNYQAALHVCRSFHLPLSIAINSRMAGGDETWQIMQQELDRGDRSWEPAVHGQTHPRDAATYAVRGIRDEILGCREDILQRLKNIPYGNRIFEHILTTGYYDEQVLGMGTGEFLFVRGFNWLDNPTSTEYTPWNEKFGFYGVGGLNTAGYDRILETREPKGRFYAADVKDLNDAFDKVCQAGGIFHALWHPDRFRNSVVYDPRPGIDGQQGSTLVQHLAHVANRRDVWYVANGWLYAYRYVAEHARVTPPKAARSAGGNPLAERAAYDVLTPISRRPSGW